MSDSLYPRGVDSARVIQVIETKSARGSGTTEQPARIVTEYWTLDGEKLAEHDPTCFVPETADGPCDSGPMVKNGARRIEDLINANLNDGAGNIRLTYAETAEDHSCCETIEDFRAEIERRYKSEANLAQFLGRSRQQLSKRLLGQHNLKLSEVNALSKAMDMPVSEIIRIFNF